MPTPLSRSLNYKLEYIFRKWYEFKKISNGPRFRHSVLWKKRFRHSILWKKKVQAFDSLKEKVQPFQIRCVEKYIILILWFPSSAVSPPLPRVSPRLSTAPWPDLAPSPSGRLLRHLATHRYRDLYMLYHLGSPYLETSVLNMSSLQLFEGLTCMWYNDLCLPAAQDEINKKNIKKKMTPWDQWEDSFVRSKNRNVYSSSWLNSSSIRTG